MKERPILFSKVMVEAILRGDKTQTRRIAKHVDHGMVDGSPEEGASYGFYDTRRGPLHEINPRNDSPFGAPGDRLWVREAFLLPSPPTTDPNSVCVDYRATLSPEPNSCDRVWWDNVDDRVVQIAQRMWDRDVQHARMGWRPGIFLPRWASRIRLEITNVRLERLHEIKNHEEDVLAEGLIEVVDHPGSSFPARYGLTPDTLTNRTAWAAFSRVWNSIHGDRHWDTNPWVWVVTYRQVTT